jgi:hypothetical protein
VRVAARAGGHLDESEYAVRRKPRLGEHGEMARARDDLKVCVESAGRGPAAGERVDGVVCTPDHGPWNMYVRELVEGEARDAAGKELLDRGVSSLDPEGTFELRQGGMAGLRSILAPGVSEDAADDPVRDGEYSIEGRVVGVDE